jgi:Flp pilus assembly protein CpaB
MKTLAFIVLGIVLACGLGAMAGLASRLSDPVDRSPTDVLIAAKETKEGEPVAQTRSFTMPANLVTESMIRASDWPKVSKRPVNAPVLEGDLLTWQLFAPTARFEATKRCVLANHSKLEEAVTGQFATELRAMEPAALELTPPPAAPKGATVRVLVAAANLKQGTALEAKSLEAVELPVAFFTESLIQESEREAVTGATVVTAIQAGDVVWWQHLQRGDVLGPNVCVSRLEATTARARKEYAEKSVATFELQGATP